MMGPIEEKLRTYISTNILFNDQGYPFEDDDSFIESQILDSTNILDLVLFVEKEFDLTIDDRDIIPQNFDSITRLSYFIRSKLNRYAIDDFNLNSISNDQNVSM